MKTKLAIALVLLAYAAAFTWVGGWVVVLVMLVVLGAIAGVALLCGWLLSQLLAWIDRGDTSTETDDEAAP
ncbi:hypothetical protein [Rhodanobacter lindaniclasticus]